MYKLNRVPTVWQHCLDELFHDMGWVKVFMDDTRITGYGERSHFTAKKEFFQKSNNGFKSKLAKSEFFFFFYENS